MEDKERPSREGLNIDKSKTAGTYTFSDSERSELKNEQKDKCKRVPRFATCLQNSGLPTGQHLQDNGPTQWMSDDSLGKFTRRI